MAWENNNQEFRFLAFKEWVPDPLRGWLYILFLACFQFSNGMYFTAMAQMSGYLSITTNAVKMMSHSMLIGLSMFFPLAMRLKFRFTNKDCLMTAALLLAAINLIVPHIESVAVLVVLCFVGGFVRLWGTFECFSNLLPKIAPDHNYSVFLSFVFFVVLGVINLFDIASTQVIYYYSWQHIHLLSVGLLLMTALVVLVTMRRFRPMPKMPLYGIDWMGFVLWSVFILSLIGVAQYGEQLGWLSSPRIRVMIAMATFALAFNCARMVYIRHPYFEIAAFRVRNFVNLLVLFLALGFMLGAKNVLQNAFTGGVLHLDMLATAKLKWFDFCGMALGALFSWFVLVKLRWGVKRVTFIGFVLVMIYLLAMMSLINPQTSMWQLAAPLVMLGFGHIAIFIALTVYLQATAPFKVYFQSLCILGFIRTGIASPIADAIFSRGISGLVPKNVALLGYDVNPSVMGYESMAHIGTEAFCATLRDMFGWCFLVGVVVLLFLAASRFKRKIKFRPYPTLARLYNAAISTFGHTRKKEQENAC